MLEAIKCRKQKRTLIETTRLWRLHIPGEPPRIATYADISRRIAHTCETCPEMFADELHNRYVLKLPHGVWAERRINPVVRTKARKRTDGSEQAKARTYR